eukprot:COSAG02_NODE_2504_length_8663_cov_3.628211_5_plen_116_part_00
MRAISAEKGEKGTAKSKGANLGWVRPASQLEDSLMQGVPAQALLDPDSSGFTGELHSAFTGTVTQTAKETYNSCWSAVEEGLGELSEKLLCGTQTRGHGSEPIWYRASACARKPI